MNRRYKHAENQRFFLIVFVFFVPREAFHPVNNHLTKNWLRNQKLFQVLHSFHYVSMGK